LKEGHAWFYRAVPTYDPLRYSFVHRYIACGNSLSMRTPCPHTVVAVPYNLRSCTTNCCRRGAPDKLDCCFEYSAIETKAHLQNTLFLDAPQAGEGNGIAGTGNVFTLVIAS